MNLIEALLMWASSLASWIGTKGVELTLDKSPDDILRRSAWVNLRCGDREAELILWESGEAEFSASSRKAGITQEHYEIGGVEELASVLRRLLESMD